MDILSLIPIQALFFVGVLIVLIIVLVFILLKKGKKKADNTVPVQNQIPPIPQQGTPLVDINQPQTQAQISPQLAKPDEGKFVMIIFAVAIVTILIPLVAIIIVNKQRSQEMQKTSAGLTKSPLCNAITITDTLGTVLSETALQNLRPNDEVKILIATTGDNITKARFRVNGSEWQEVTLKEANNFIGNYILTSGTNKFTIEAEVFDSEKGWL